MHSHLTRKAILEILTVGVKSGAMSVRIVGEVCQPLGDAGVVEVDHRQLRSAALHQGLAHVLDIKLLVLSQEFNVSQPLVEVHPDVRLGHSPPEDGRVRGGDHPAVDHLGLSQPLV